MECSHKKITSVQVQDATYPFPVFRDECAECGCVMEPDWNNTQNGITPMKARPLAKVIDFLEFKARKEAKLKGVSNG